MIIDVVQGKLRITGTNAGAWKLEKMGLEFDGRENRCGWCAAIPPKNGIANVLADAANAVLDEVKKSRELEQTLMRLSGMASVAAAKASELAVQGQSIGGPSVARWATRLFDSLLAQCGHQADCTEDGGFAFMEAASSCAAAVTSLVLSPMALRAAGIVNEDGEGGEDGEDGEIDVD